jgi:2-polyprenyl-3-methyl-5-hydroxy-6-metoxy-1,4-benzoquinol methylase
MHESGILETIRGPLGESDASRFLFFARDRLMALPGQFCVVECRECGVVYVNPRPPATALGKYYVAELPIRQVKPLPEGNGLRPRLITRWARHGALKRITWVENHVAPFRPGNTVLDVGCGTGAFLYWLRELRRAAAWGVDFSPDVVGYVRERLGIPVAQGTMETADLPPNTFDWVTLWDVIEHDPAPRATLAKVREVLKPDGFLVLETPNVQSPVARLFRRWWLEFGVVPRHLVFNSPRTLTALLTRCGFRV